MKENEPSLRLISEWIIVRLIAEDRTTRLNDLYEYLRNAHQYRTGAVCAWLSIASHVASLLSDQIEQVNLIYYFLFKSNQILIRLNI
jgi:hypothetical protein